MKTAQAEALIEAPIAKVWEVMLDLPRYPEWNPFTVRIDVPQGIKEGGPIDLHVRWASGRGLVSHEKIVRIAAPGSPGMGPGKASFEYNFGGPMAALNLVRSHRIQALEAVDGGRTRYRTTIRMTGLLSGLTPVASVQDGFDRQAAALKARCESLTSAAR